MLTQNIQKQQEQNTQTTHLNANYDESHTKKWLVFTALVIGLCIIGITGLWLILNNMASMPDHTVWQKGLPF